MSLKSIRNFICPRIAEDIQAPLGFSRTMGWGITLIIPLPFRYKAWSLYKRQEVWGNVTFYLNSKQGIDLWWRQDNN